MKDELDQIITFGKAVKAFRVVVDESGTVVKTPSKIERTPNAERINEQLREDIKKLVE